MLFDKIIEKLRLFLKEVYGEQFDQAYIKMRENDPSPRSKHALTLPLIELSIFAYFQSQAKSQSEQINIMSLLKGYSAKTSRVFDPKTNI